MLILSFALNVKFYIDTLAYKELLDMSLDVPENTIEDLKEKLVEEIKENNKSKHERSH